MLAVVFDTETTGLIANRLVRLDEQPHIIEFGAFLVNLENGDVVTQLDYLIKPPILLSDKPPYGSKKTITDITGITNEMLENQPNFARTSTAIKNLFESATLAIAHNFTFDQEILDIEFERLNQKLIWSKGVCTVESTVHLTGERLTLSKLYKYLFDETFNDAHRALADAKATMKCAVELYKRKLI